MNSQCDHYWKLTRRWWWWWQMITLIICYSIHSEEQFQSLMVLANPGHQFMPLNERAQLLSEIFIDTFQSCAVACNMNTLCRIFDFNVDQSKRCRLFEGDINTLGTIVSSSSPNSNVGLVQITPDLFTEYGQWCSSNDTINRYLICGMNSIYQCTPHSYWNSSISMCIPQTPTLGAACKLGMDMCRADLNLTCLQFFQCGPISLLSGTTLINTSSLTSDTSMSVLRGVVSIMTYEIGGMTAIIFGDVTLRLIVRFFDDGITIRNLTIPISTWPSGNRIYEPANMYRDPNNTNNLYVVDTTFARVLLFTAMQTVMPVPRVVIGVSGSPGSGPYQIYTPIGIALDNQSRIFISEMNNHRVMRWTLNATYGVLIAGNGTAGSSSLQLRWPRSLYIDQGNSWLYVADTGNHRIQRFALNGNFPAIGVTIAGGNGAGSGSNQLNSPEAFWISPKTGNIYIADSANSRIQRWDRGAQTGVTLAGSPNGISGGDAVHLWYPRGLTLNVNETLMYVSDSYNSRIQRFALL